MHPKQMYFLQADWLSMTQQFSPLYGATKPISRLRISAAGNSLGISFSQLPYSESLSDTVLCLKANPGWLTRWHLKKIKNIRYNVLKLSTGLAFAAFAMLLYTF